MIYRHRAGGHDSRLSVFFAFVASLASISALGQNTAVIPEPRTPQIWGQRWQEKLARVKQGNVDLVFIGDSITEAWDYPQNQPVWSAYCGARNGIGLGFSGARTENILWMLDNGLIDGISPKVAVIMIGTNNTDGVHFPKANSPEEIVEGIGKIVHTVRTKLPKTKILLLRVFPRANLPGTRESADRVGELSARLADGLTVQYLDLNSHFLKPDGSIDTSIMPDSLHPNPVGNLIWAQAMEPYLRRLMGKPANTAATAQPGIEKDFYEWMPRHQAAIEQIRKQPPDLVFIGDSITHMWGGPPQSNVVHGQAVWDRYYGKRKAVNLGFGWDRTQQVLWRLNNGEFEGIHPKAVVLLIGTNNLNPHAARANTNEEILDGIRAIVKTIRSRSPKTQIVLLGLLPRGAEPEDIFRVRVRQINSELAKWNGRDRIHYVDLGPKLLDSSGHFLPGITYDNLHLDEKGYGLWAETIEPILSKALGDSPRVGQSSMAGVRHAVLATGEETFLLSADGETIWSYPGASRDGWVLPNGHVLLAVNRCSEYPGGAVVEVDRAGKRVFAFKGSQDEVDTVQPLPDGRILLTESGDNPRVLEIDRTGKVIADVRLQCQKENHHMQTRMARKLANGNYLVPHTLDKAVKEYAPDGRVVWSVETPNWPFTAIRLTNGNTLIGCTRGNLVIEVDRQGKIVWQLTNEDLPGPLIKDACGVQRLSNGNTVVAAYGASGPNEVKLVEVTRDKKLVWSLQTGRSHGIHTFQILDDHCLPVRGVTLK